MLSQYHVLYYFFRQRKNIVRANGGKLPYVQLEFPSYRSMPNHYVQYRGCDSEPLFEPFNPDVQLCSSFANHGHCSEGKHCTKSHDIDQIVISKDANTKSNNRKRKRAKDSGLESMDECTEKKAAKPPDTLEVNVDHEVLNSSKIKQNGGSHRAGYDAFMTGYGFATFIVHSALTNSSTETCKSEAVSRFLGVPTSPEFTDLNIMNRIYLVCKDIPFMIRKSAFSRNSVAHSEKYTLIKS